MTTYTNLDTTPENMTTLGRWADNHEKHNSMTFRESRIAADGNASKYIKRLTSTAEQLPETATAEEINRAADAYLAENAARVTVVTVLRTRLRLRRAHAALYGDTRVTRREVYNEADQHEIDATDKWKAANRVIELDGDLLRETYRNHAKLHLPALATPPQVDEVADEYHEAREGGSSVVGVLRTRLRMRRADRELNELHLAAEPVKETHTERVQARARELVARDTAEVKANIDGIVREFGITGDSSEADIERAVDENWGGGIDRESVMWHTTKLRFEAARDRLAARPLTEDEREERRRADALELVSRDDAEADRMWFDLATEHAVEWSSTDKEVEAAVALYWAPGSELNIDAVAWLATNLRFTKVRNVLRRSAWESAATRASRDTYEDGLNWSDLAFKHGLDIDGDGANLDEAVERYLAATYPGAGTTGLVPITTVRFQRARSRAQAIRAALKTVEPKRSNLGGHVQGPGPDLADSIPVFLPNVGELGTVTAIPLDADGNERPGASVISDAFTNIGIAADTLRVEKAKVELPRHFRDKYQADQLKTRPFVGGLPAPMGTIDGAVVFKDGEPVDLPGGEIRTDLTRSCMSVSITFDDPDGKLHDLLMNISREAKERETFDDPDGKLHDLLMNISREAKERETDETIAMMTERHRDECDRYDAEGQGEPAKRSMITDALDAILIAGVTAYWRARLAARELTRDVASWIKFL